MSVAEQHLSILFDADVDAEVLDEQTQGDLQLTVCNIRYRPPNHSTETTGRSGSIRQTVVLMSADAFDFPKFQLAGTVGRGPSRFLLTKLLGVTGLKFPDTPRFTEQYLLFGMPEAALRALFPTEVREYFSDHPGWSVRGDRQQLVIFRDRQLIEEAELDGFISDATQILSQLGRSEQQLDQRPELNRRAGVSDLANMHQQYGGFAGAVIQRQLQKILVTRQQLELYLAEPVPRTPPAKLKRQVLGDSFPLVIIGIVFIVVGVVSGVLWLALAEGGLRWVGLAPMLLFPMIGITMSCLTLRYRSRKTRLLRNGRLVTGTIEDVQRTNVSVNQRVLHKVSLQLNDRSVNRTADCTVDEQAANRAREHIQNKTPVRILVDPQDETQVLCIDLLVIQDTSDGA